MLDRLLAGPTFDPGTEDATFRIAVTDAGSHVVCPRLSRLIRPSAPRIAVQFVTWHAGAFDALEHGRLDLSVNARRRANAGAPAWRGIYDEHFVCVVAKPKNHKR